MSKTNSSEDWAAKLKVVETTTDGKVQTRIIRRTASDFQFEGELGEGSYSTVMLAKDKHTDKLYAIKVLDKRHIVKEKKVKYVNIEKNSLNILGRRNGIVHLFFTFQDEYSLYFVLDYAANGELLTLIKKYGTLNEDVTRYYTAQIMDALKYIHSKGIIHRDLKPENILLDGGYKIQITDFGTAKILDKDPITSKFIDDGRAKSFVGTAEYVSPELLNDKAVGKPCDIWALGCIVYQMIAGRPPFKATNDYLTFQQVMKVKYAFSAGFPTIIRDLVKRILVPIPEDRPTIKELERHLFFQEIDWRNSEESVWYSPPPEFSPYKISAQAMKPVPELGEPPKIRIPLKNKKSDSSNKSIRAGGSSSSLKTSTASSSSTSIANSNNNNNNGYSNISTTNIKSVGTQPSTDSSAASTPHSNTPTIVEQPAQKSSQQKKPIKTLSANAAAIALTKIAISDIAPHGSKSKKKGSSKDQGHRPHIHRRQHSTPSVRTGRGTDMKMKYHEDAMNTNINALSPSMAANSATAAKTASNTVGGAPPTTTKSKKSNRSVSLPSSPQTNNSSATSSPLNSPKQASGKYFRALHHYLAAPSAQAPPRSPRFKVSEFSGLDFQWYKFLVNQHERILKCGVLYIRYTTTDLFEKKFKGKLANSPLYFKGKRNSSGNFNNSLLTQMVNGNGRSGLRKGTGGFIGVKRNSGSDAISPAGSAKEANGIVHYVKTAEIQQVEAEIQKSWTGNNGASDSPTYDANGGANNNSNSAANNSSTGSGGMLKKLLNTTRLVMNTGNNIISGSGNTSNLLDFNSSRMILVTNLGRLLILGRRPGSNPALDDNYEKYEVISEIDLTHSSIRVKEIILDSGFNNSVTASSNNGNGLGSNFNGTGANNGMFMVLGVFAVMTASTTTLFQVDKNLLNSWTETITEAKLSGQDYKLNKVIEKDPSGGTGMLTGTEAALMAANLAGTGN